jgi:hypothetical protein
MKHPRQTKDQLNVRLLSKISTDAGTMKEKSFIILVCVIGILAASYGMIKDNNIIFVIGLLFVVGGYLLIRRKLKKSTQKKS